MQSHRGSEFFEVPTCLWDGINYLADTLAMVGTAGVTGIAIVLNSAAQAVVDGPLILGFDTGVAVAWSGDARIRNLRLQNKNQVIYDNCHDGIHSDGTLHLFNYMGPSNDFGGQSFPILSIGTSTTTPADCRLTISLNQPVLFYDTTRYSGSPIGQSIKVSVSNPTSQSDGPCGVWWGQIVSYINPSISGTVVSSNGTLVLDLLNAPTEESYCPARLLISKAKLTTGKGAPYNSSYGTTSVVYIFSSSQCPGTALSITNTDGGAFTIAEWFDTAGGIYLGTSTNHITVSNTGQDGNASSADQLTYTLWFDDTAQNCVYANGSAQSSFTSVRVSTSTSLSTSQRTNKIVGSHLNGNGGGYGSGTSSAFGIGRALDLRTGSIIVEACTTSGDIRVRSTGTPTTEFTHLELGPGDYSASNFLVCDASENPGAALDPAITIYCASGVPPPGLPAQFLAPAASVATVQQRANLSTSGAATINSGTTWLLAYQQQGVATATLTLNPGTLPGAPLTITTRSAISNLTLAGVSVIGTWPGAPALAASTSIRLLWDAATGASGAWYVT